MCNPDVGAFSQIWANYIQGKMFHMQLMFIFNGLEYVVAKGSCS